MCCAEPLRLRSIHSCMTHQPSHAFPLCFNRVLGASTPFHSADVARLACSSGHNERSTRGLSSPQGPSCLAHVGVLHLWLLAHAFMASNRSAGATSTSGALLSPCPHPQHCVSSSSHGRVLRPLSPRVHDLRSSRHLRAASADDRH